MDPVLKPRPKIKAAAQTAGTLSVAAVVALLLGADPDDSTVQAVSAVVLAVAPVIAGYVKRDALSRQYYR